MDAFFEKKVNSAKSIQRHAECTFGSEIGSIFSQKKKYIFGRFLDFLWKPDLFAKAGREAAVAFANRSGWPGFSRLARDLVLEVFSY